jgi:hypothetical protein
VGVAAADPQALALTQARAQDRIRGQMMQVALKRLLDQVPGSRRALPHLAALEDGLGRRGACAAEQVPPHWLGRIINQLSSLPLREDDHELQELLSRLCRALADHQRPPQDLPVLTEVYGSSTSPPAPAAAGAAAGPSAVLSGERPAASAAALSAASPAAAPKAFAAAQPPRPAWADAPAFYADHPAARSRPTAAPASDVATVTPARPDGRAMPQKPQKPGIPGTAETAPLPRLEPAAEVLDEDGLPRFTTMPKASELELEPEVFQTFFGDRLRPPDRRAPPEPGTGDPVDDAPLSPPGNAPANAP